MVENEIHFLRWNEFRRMAPAVLQLEVARIDRLIRTQPVGTDFYNTLIKARFELKNFMACLEGAEKESLEECCAAHLRAALLLVSMRPADLDENTRHTLNYVLDRLKYICDHIGRIY